MSKSPRKSIVASFGLLSSELETELVEQKPATPVPSGGNRVGAGVVAAAHRAIDDIRSERDRLRALIESGAAAVRHLDPSLVDPSPYPDRLPDDDGATFEAFKRSIETEGQKVPVQVRKHPSSPDRFQIVYGHRRWLAARQLGRPLLALEVEISDLDLFLAQGIENANRQDLTWIERALFASRMDQAGIKPRYIYAALAIEDAELARMRNVYRVVPADIIEAIGRAPKIGRPRWLELAKTVSDVPTAIETLRAALVEKLDATETSDQRFQRLLNTVKPVPPRRVAPVISDKRGRLLATLVASPKEVRIAAEGSVGTEFLKFLQAELPSLAERFASEHEQEKP
ncbi:plasmid partitioning protein RepB [Ensifer sp. Root127]|uniref:plasmid partitioning protein RepB n=1 Tax=Ensifer sp. Root127 TaxID=1736440 RepID=UPI00070B6D21|nr:plasmid partitioning protein RepB [Ensifer sp. Root127]KQW76791.1 plasmid partitioning protein RepB [Ensifer sp. Root127]